jgi:hypothetical protein
VGSIPILEKLYFTSNESEDSTKACIRLQYSGYVTLYEKVGSKMIL